MSVLVDPRHTAVRRQAAARRRQQRLYSAGNNGAIVEKSHALLWTDDTPARRILFPPRHAVTRPQLFDYYKLVTGDKLSSMWHDATREDYSYSWFTPVYIERRLAKIRGSHRLREALFAAKIPLSAVEEGARGVFDSGHLYSPICRQLRRRRKGSTTCKSDEAMMQNYENTGEEMDGTVILVRPLAWELPTEEEMVRDEFTRVAPKGREWDRQHALRHGVGPTAQEAIIDCRIDSRYRRPGDYVRRNSRGEFLDARGRPIRAIPTLGEETQ